MKSQRPFLDRVVFLISIVIMCILCGVNVSAQDPASSMTQNSVSSNDNQPVTVPMPPTDEISKDETGRRIGDRFPLNTALPSAYLTFERKEEEIEEDNNKPVTFVWLRFHNNTNWRVSLKMGGGERPDEVKLVYDILDKNNKVMEQSDCTVCSLNWLEKDKSVPFKIPLEYFKNSAAMRISYTFEGEDSPSTRAQEALRYVYFDTSFLAKEQANVLLKENKTDKSVDTMPVSVRQKQDEFGRKITNFLNTSEELRNYSKNGYTSTFTGDFRSIPKALNNELNLAFPECKFYIAKMRVLIDAPSKDYNLILVTNAFTGYVKGFVWGNYWTICPSNSFKKILKGQQAKSEEDALSKVKTFAKLIVYTNNDQIGDAKIQNGEVNVELIRGKGVLGILKVRMNKNFKFESLVITDAKGKNLKCFVVAENDSKSFGVKRIVLTVPKIAQKTEPAGDEPSADKDQLNSENARRIAEKFVACSGFTTKQLQSSECKKYNLSCDDSTFPCEILEEKAYGFFQEQQNGKKGWTIVFRTRGKLKSKTTGIAVTMDQDGIDVKISKTKVFLKLVENKY
jgi:hypothetical protein